MSIMAEGARCDYEIVSYVSTGLNVQFRDDQLLLVPRYHNSLHVPPFFAFRSIKTVFFQIRGRIPRILVLKQERSPTMAVGVESVLFWVFFLTCLFWASLLISPSTHRSGTVINDSEHPSTQILEHYQQTGAQSRPWSGQAPFTAH